VLFVNRNAAFGVGALIGAAAAIVWDRRSRLRTAPAPPAPDTRQRELREKLAGTQQAEAPAPAAEPPKPPEPPATPPPSQPEAKPAPPAPPPGPPPADEFEAMRRRIHEEGKAAAEEMRRAPDEPS
jgi:hypothetical protein